jgi:hypothetical protein
VVVVAGRPFFRNAWRDLRQRRVGMDVPVALSIGLTFKASLVAAWLGSVHCMAMCGGLAGALAFAIPVEAPAFARVRLLASVSAGRILGYAIAGGLAGGVGLGLAQLLGSTGAALLRALAGTILVAIALTIAGWWRTPLAFERMGARAWRRLQPLAVGLRRDLHVPKPFTPRQVADGVRVALVRRVARQRIAHPVFIGAVANPAIATVASAATGS